MTYIIDELVPVDLQFAKDWRPKPLWRQIYAALHTLAGTRWPAGF